MVRCEGPASEREVAAMVEMLAHRGPDGEGVFVRDGVALGHRRLSIIDLETGDQPMMSRDRRQVVVFNGEIYNFRRLREELEAKGHRFFSRSDTEVLLHAWREWGPSFVEKLRGMFAFCLVDFEQGVALLARDHFGIKPLYYFLRSGYLAFASELGALESLPDCPKRPDPAAIDMYLSLGYIPSPSTIYEGVAKLAPASRLMVHLDGRVRGPESYWRLSYEPIYGRASEDWAEELEESLTESVRAHLVSDVPFGAFLSGGLDSTAVATAMAGELGRPVKTFSIGFEEEDFDELPYANAVARRLGTEHRVRVVRPDALAILPRLVEHYGEPFADSSAIPTFYVSELAREEVPMVLSGDGGDEALGGYGKYVSWLRPTDPVPRRPAWKRVLRPPLSVLLPGVFPKDPVSRRREIGELHGVNALVSRGWRRRLWKGDYHRGLDFDWNPYRDAVSEATITSPLSAAQYADYQLYLPGDILVKVDIASMMHGLEVRTPFVDVRFAEFAARIPAEAHVWRASDGKWITKGLLKLVLSRNYSDEFVHRRKRGFAMPLRRWFQQGGALRGELEAGIASPDAALARYFERAEMTALLREHDEGQDRSGELWALLFLEAWLQRSGPVARPSQPRRAYPAERPAAVVGRQV